MSKITFTVEFELPSGATIAQAKEYIEASLATECGFRDPDSDPMQRFNRSSVKVYRLVTRK